MLHRPGLCLSCRERGRQSKDKLSPNLSRILCIVCGLSNIVFTCKGEKVEVVPVDQEGRPPWTQDIDPEERMTKMIDILNIFCVGSFSWQDLTRGSCKASEHAQ
jgi:hypothetical protein